MDEVSLRNDILVGFEYSYLHDDWVNPLEEALAGVTISEAQWKPHPDSKSIWEIVLHTAVWNENIVQRVETGEKCRPAEGAWPPLPIVQDEAAWKVAQTRLNDALESVQTMLQATPLEKIQNSPYGLPDLLCRLTHNGYHLGQITILREWYQSLGL